MNKFILSKAFAKRSWCFLLAMIMLPISLFAKKLPKVKRNTISAVENSKRMLAKRLPDIAKLAGLNPDDYKNADVEEQNEGELSDPTKAAEFQKISLKEIEDSFEEAANNQANSQTLDGVSDEASLSVNDSIEAVQQENEFYKSEFLTFLSTMAPVKTVTNAMSFSNGREGLIKSVMGWLGTRYRFGGMGKNGIDCSAFTGAVMRAIGVNLPRTARMQYGVGTSVSRDNLQYGDLIFFNTRGGVSHVGIYLGSNLFTHSSSRYGVTVSELTASYYSSRYIGGRRVAALNNLAVK